MCTSKFQSYSSLLLEIIKKYSKDYVEQGEKYIEKAKAATKVFKINIEHMTGKAQI